MNVHTLRLSDKRESTISSCVHAAAYYLSGQRRGTALPCLQATPSFGVNVSDGYYACPCECLLTPGWWRRALTYDLLPRHCPLGLVLIWRVFSD